MVIQDGICGVKCYQYDEQVLLDDVFQEWSEDCQDCFQLEVMV